MIRPVMALALPVLLGGCTTLYPPLYSAPTIAGAEVEKEPPQYGVCRGPSDPLEQTLACAEILQGAYSDGYQQSARWQDISQLPIIGAAAAAGWILLKDNENAAKKVGKIGIGALAYSAARDQLLPKDMPVTFIKGHGALGCVLSLGEFFHGEHAGNASEGLEDQLSETYLLRVDVQKLRYLDPQPGDTSATPEMLAAARTLADQAITISAAQLEASQAQLGAFQFANAPFRKAVTDIASWVASRGRATRANHSYDTLLGTFKPKDAQTAAVETREVHRRAADPNKTGSELVRDLATASSLLANAAIRLKGATPDFKSRLDAVAKCADLPAS